MAGLFATWLSRLTGARRRKILLTSADAGLTELVQTYLSSLKREWLLSNTCNGSIDLLDREDEAPALILIDAQLPGISNGFELLRQVRNRRDTFRVPVVMLHQGMSMQDQSALLAKFQNVFLMNKPIVAKTMLEVCQEALRKGDKCVVAKTSLRVPTPPLVRTRIRE